MPIEEKVTELQIDRFESHGIAYCDSKFGDRKKLRPLLKSPFS